MLQASPSSTPPIWLCAGANFRNLSTRLGNSLAPALHSVVHVLRAWRALCQSSDAGCPTGHRVVLDRNYLCVHGRSAGAQWFPRKDRGGARTLRLATPSLCFLAHLSQTAPKHQIALIRARWCDPPSRTLHCLRVAFGFGIANNAPCIRWRAPVSALAELSHAATPRSVVSGNSPRPAPIPPPTHPAPTHHPTTATLTRPPTLTTPRCTRW
jgi:hypothetical protein